MSETKDEMISCEKHESPKLTSTNLIESLKYLSDEIDDVERELDALLIKDELVANLYDKIRRRGIRTMLLTDLQQEIEKMSPALVRHLCNIMRDFDYTTKRLTTYEIAEKYSQKSSDKCCECCERCECCE